MPTERFLHLPNEKQERILLAAVGEFTRAPYDEVSISKIVQAAEIPRGSFYQYFADKQDLLEYIMKGFREKMLSTAEEALISSGGDPFEVFPALMSRVIEMAERLYNPDFFRNIYSCVSAKHLQNFDFIRLKTDEIFVRFGHLINYPPFDSISSEQKSDIIDILIILLYNAIGRCFIEDASAEASLLKFRRKIDIIRNSALLKGEHNA